MPVKKVDSSRFARHETQRIARLAAIAMQVDEHFALEDVHFRFLIADSLNSEVGAHVDHGRSWRFDAEANGRFWNVGRDAAVFQADAGVIDELERGGACTTNTAPDRYSTSMKPLRSS